MSSSIVKVTDYGLGTYNGHPLVLVPMSASVCFHRRDHAGRIDGVTFTEEFAIDGIGLRPCRVCWPAASPSPTENPQ